MGACFMGHTLVWARHVCASRVCACHVCACHVCARHVCEGHVWARHVWARMQLWLSEYLFPHTMFHDMHSFFETHGLYQHKHRESERAYETNILTMYQHIDYV